MTVPQSWTTTSLEHVHLARLGVHLHLGEGGREGHAGLGDIGIWVTVTTTGTMSPNQSMSRTSVAPRGIGLDERPSVDDVHFLGLGLELRRRPAAGALP